jgi:hypothetical protein
VTNRVLRIVLGTLTAVAVALALINAFYAVEPLHKIWLRATSHDLPTGWAALMGALLGLSAIAWQTHRGFRNLIASQQHQAELDREAMHERAELDKDARLHQAALQRQAQAENREDEKKVLAAALHGELLASITRLSNTRQWLELLLVTAGELAKSGGSLQAPLKIPRVPTPVYDANIAKMGLLGASIVADVAEVYGILQAELEWTQPNANLAKILVKGVIDTMPDRISDILHVGSRLMAIQYGTEDPGLLSANRKSRKKQFTVARQKKAT